MQNPINRESSSQQAITSSFDGTAKGFLAAAHRDWHELSTEEKTDGTVSAAGYDIMASAIPEINFLDSQIDSK